MVSSQPVKRAKSRLQRSTTVQRQPDWRPASYSLTTKARSRLKKHFSKPHFTSKNLRIFRKGFPRFLPSLVGVRELIRTLVLQRLPFLPLLGISLILIVTSGFFFTAVSPQKVANIPVYHAYAPAIFLIWMITSTIAIVLFAHIRRGILVGLCTSSLILFRVQDFTLTLSEMLTVLSFYLIIECILSLVEKINLTFKTSPQRRRRKV